MYSREFSKHLDKFIQIVVQFQELYTKVNFFLFKQELFYIKS